MKTRSFLVLAGTLFLIGVINLVFWSENASNGNLVIGLTFLPASAVWFLLAARQRRIEKGMGRKC
ncbi:MAG: hypothetical protein D6807_01045 [Alphaproteobacteria bacterium]|nr:MAG: hypothetical protein D6807_01045 [Alphaproteobacteria bacterium]